MNIDKQELLNQLEMVSPGLSKRDIIEQSSCFIFKNKHVITYNDEISCSHPTELNIEGAVVSEHLLLLLRKINHQEIGCHVEGNELVIKRKNGRSKIRMEEKILLPYKSVNKPEIWHRLPEDFLEAIKIAKACASTDQSLFALTCLLITPKHIDACDRQQACQYKIKMPIKKKFLIRRESITHLTTMDVSHMSESKDWVHFKNDSGLVISCRRYSNIEDFYPLDKILEPMGTKLTMPKGIKDAIETSDIFVGEGPGEDGRVHIKLKANKIYVKGKCLDGENVEMRRSKYKGKDLSFVITARLLLEFTEKFQTCLVSSKKLCVKDGNFLYATSIGEVK